MSQFKRDSIKCYQIPAMQMFLQAEEGTSTWEEAERACRMYDLFEEAEIAGRMARGQAAQDLPNDTPIQSCPSCGGQNGSHRFGCKSIISKIRSSSRWPAGYGRKA